MSTMSAVTAQSNTLFAANQTKVSLLDTNPWNKIFAAEIQRNEEQASSEGCRDLMVSSASGSAAVAFLTIGAKGSLLALTWPIYLSLLPIGAGLCLFGYTVYMITTSGEKYKDNIVILKNYHRIAVSPGFQNFVMQEGLGTEFSYDQMLKVCRFYNERSTYTSNQERMNKEQLKDYLQK